VHGIDRWVQTVVSVSDRACAPAPGIDLEPGRSEPGISPGQLLRGKPHPDVFIEAARRLGVAPSQCIVFEDAPLGVEAARRAGMRAVALTTTLPAGAFAPYSNVIAVHADFTRLDPINVTALSAPMKEEHHA
jgi:beta-phosphoglucomutase-like phosphatase (HAD superfamily)